MTRRASPAQAQRLAGLFCGQYGGVLCVSRGANFENATTRAIVKNGWAAPNGKSGAYPSGAPYDEYEINAAGLRALEDYLRALREKRGAAV